MNGIYLALGTNLGDKEENLLKSIYYIENEVGGVVKKSSVHLTKAWGNEQQPDFLNMVLQVETALSPHELLEKCLLIEKKMGRIREEKWGPRIIDIDILYYGDEYIHDDKLQIPHPFIFERPFVYEPLKEVLEG